MLQLRKSLNRFLQLIHRVKTRPVSKAAVTTVKNRVLGVPEPRSTPVSLVGRCLLSSGADGMVELVWQSSCCALWFDYLEKRCHRCVWEDLKGAVTGVCVLQRPGCPCGPQSWPGLPTASAAAARALLGQTATAVAWQHLCPLSSKVTLFSLSPPIKSLNNSLWILLRSFSFLIFHTM